MKNVGLQREITHVQFLKHFLDKKKRQLQPAVKLLVVQEKPQKELQWMMGMTTHRMPRFCSPYIPKAQQGQLSTLV